MLKSTTPEGNLILSYYKTNGELSCRMRELLVERIIYSELGLVFNKRYNF